MIKNERTIRRSRKPMKYYKSIRFKIVLYSVLCVIGISICGNLYLFSYLNHIIMEKSDNIDKIYLEALSNKIESGFEEMFQVSINNVNHLDVIKAMRLKKVDTVSEKKILLKAQDTLNDSMATLQSNPYINKLILFNDSGVMVQGIGNHMAFMEDAKTVIQNKLADRTVSENRDAIFVLDDSVTPYMDECFSILLKVNDFSGNKEVGYFYMEIDTSFVRDLLEEYQQLNYVVVWDEMNYKNQISLLQDESILKELFAIQELDSALLRDQRFKMDKTRIRLTNVSLYNFTNSTELFIKNNEMVYTLFWVLLLTGFVALGILLIVSKWITKPISRLIARIQKITQNDFSYDPEIEQTEDEIGEIGKVVNEMVQSVANLMRESIRVSEEKSNIEMAMLQAQVNPHFLYNTLDSIHWMAVIQKAPGIINVTRSLSNLLKNMAKGVSDKISLQQELSLLLDYITIQDIRYAGTFEYTNTIEEEFYSYKIVKMTLQPIVENAIFHGIEPSGRMGNIRLGAYEEGEYLFITVWDNGVGIEDKKAEELLKDKRSMEKGSMSGIGISNVHRRLQLIYGSGCGLSVESCPNSYTLITVKIRKEKI